METAHRILVVDDEETLREGLKTYLEFEGYSVTAFASGEEVLQSDLSGIDLILLDIMMGGMSGMELAQILAQDVKTSDIPIIFLTAKDSEEDMVTGLNLGADDYIVKPYSIRNVIARIEAVLRRSSKRKHSSGISCDRNSLVCMVDGNALKLPRKEFEILALLLENKDRIFTREELLQRIWPEKTIVTDRSVDVHITRLRGKISPYGKNIISRSGYGYGWNEI